MGIKLSLGANPLRLHCQLISSGLVLVILGLAVGLILSYITNPLLGAILAGVSPHDVNTYMSVAAFILLVALFALSIPSWRITRTEPIKSLRYE